MRAACVSAGRTARHLHTTLLDLHSLAWAARDLKPRTAAAGSGIDIRDLLETAHLRLGGAEHVTTDPLTEGDLGAVSALHETLAEGVPTPAFEGSYVTWAQLAADPGEVEEQCREHTRAILAGRTVEQRRCAAVDRQRLHGRRKRRPADLEQVDVPLGHDHVGGITRREAFLAGVLTGAERVHRHDFHLRVLPVHVEDVLTRRARFRRILQGVWAFLKTRAYPFSPLSRPRPPLICLHQRSV